jgi:hypothetical protein
MVHIHSKKKKKGLQEAVHMLIKELKFGSYMAMSISYKDFKRTTEYRVRSETPSSYN